LKAETRDRINLLATATVIVVLAVIVLTAVVKFEPQWVNHDLEPYAKWIRFSTVTIAFVVVCLKTYWKARRHIVFWLILCGVLLLHFFGVGYFYYAGDGLPLTLFGPAVALEWALMAVVIYHVLGIGPDSVKDVTFGRR